MKLALLFVLLVCAALVHAAPGETFDEHVALARKAEADPALKEYPAIMIKGTRRHLARTMRTCAALKPSPEIKAFTLVADITPEGKPVAVEVQPATNVAECFASGFVKADFPKPPSYPGREGFPVTMKLRISQ